MNHDVSKLTELAVKLDKAVSAKTTGLARELIRMHLSEYHEHMQRFIPADEYHEDIGPVLWHRLPVSEAPHVGSTVDEGWFYEPVHILSNGETNAEFYTHFQLIHIPEH